MAEASIDFLESDNLLLLAQAAETWKCRPSRMLGISSASEATLALQIDLACAVRLWQHQAALAREQRLQETSE